MIQTWNRDYTQTLPEPGNYGCLHAHLCPPAGEPTGLDNIALAVDEFTGFFQPIRQDLNGYPFDGYLSGCVWVEHGRAGTWDEPSSESYQVSFFTSPELGDVVNNLADAADALVNHLRLAGASVEKIRWETAKL